MIAVFVSLVAAMAGSAEKPTASLWDDLSAKRAKLGSLHQEFEATRTFKTAHGNQSSKRQIVLDLAGQQWRERERYRDQATISEYSTAPICFR
jgi:hypothetical protein